jgi:uncharacterized membrane protein YkoI
MEKMNKIYFIAVLVLALLLINASFFYFSSNKPGKEETYNPTINPSDFTSNVDNKYFSLTPGKKMVYESVTQDGKERIEVYVTNEKKTVMGVETVVVWDRVWLNGELIEDTRDWYAQDKEGNVWYFGEDTAEIIDGKIINHDGAWEAGIDGAKPGIVMKANPVVGDSYRQEYYKGEAEDAAEVLSLGEKVETPYKTFNNCLKTYDYSYLDSSVQEYKYYCLEFGFVALEGNVEGGEMAELVSFDQNAQPTPAEEITEQLETGITEAKAREIALEEVPGEITDVAVERKFGKVAYVIEIVADNGGAETDVIIDSETGEVLAVEN